MCFLGSDDEQTDTTPETQGVAEENVADQGTPDSTLQEIEATHSHGTESPIVHQEEETRLVDDLSDSTSAWLAINPDKDVLNDMLFRYGVLDVMVEEVESISDFTKYRSDATYGIILSFPFAEIPLGENLEEPQEGAEKINFASQVVVNSSATLSLVNILTNIEIEKNGQLVGVESELIRNFTDFTKDMDSIDQGLAIGSSKQFKEIHDSYEQGDLLDENPQEPGARDIYHYVSYIFKEGYLWELDSSNCRPMRLNAIGQDENWLEMMKPALEQKTESDIPRYRIFVVCHNPISETQRYIVTQEEYISKRIEQVDEDTSGSDGSGTPGSTSSRAQRRYRRQDEIDFTTTNTEYQRDRLGNLMQGENERLDRLENGRKYPFDYVTRLVLHAVRKLNLEDYQQSPETDSTEFRSTPPAPQSNKRIARATVSKTQKRKQATTDAAQRGRGRGRGRPRGSRGRGRGRGQGRRETPSSDASSTETNVSSVRKRKRQDGDDRVEAARKVMARTRYDFRN